MKIGTTIKLLLAMVGVSAATAYGTFSIMQREAQPTLTSDGVANPDVHNVLFAPAVSHASVTDNDFTQAAERTVNAVVGVRNVQKVQTQNYQSMDPFFDFFFGQRGRQQQEPQTREGYGSGVIISSDGYIVTNNHVIDSADSIFVTLNDQRQFAATLVGTDPNTDIALIKVEAKDLPTVPFGASDDLKIGEWVLAVGNPFMLTSTVTAGIVSAKGRNLGMSGKQLGIESFIQTDAAVNPGNSGGALVNTAGELVGINTAIYSQTGNYAGYSFAVPSSIVQKVVTDLRQYGVTQRAMLGVTIREVNDALARSEGLTAGEGVYIEQVSEGGAADAAGLKHGDVILSIGKTPVKTVAQLQEQVARHRPGDRVEVEYTRGGKRQTTTVTLKNQQGNTDVITKKGVKELGATLAELTREDQIKYGVRYGVMVKDVKQGGLFAKAGIKAGFVIMKVNDTATRSPRDVENICEQLSTNRDASTDPVMFIVGVDANGRPAYAAVDLSK